MGDEYGEDVDIKSDYSSELRNLKRKFTKKHCSFCGIDVEKIKFHTNIFNFSTIGEVFSIYSRNRNPHRSNTQNNFLFKSLR